MSKTNISRMPELSQYFDYKNGNNKVQYPTLFRPVLTRHAATAGPTELQIKYKNKPIFGVFSFMVMI